MSVARKANTKANPTQPTYQNNNVQMKSVIWDRNGRSLREMGRKTRHMNKIPLGFVDMSKNSADSDDQVPFLDAFVRMLRRPLTIQAISLPFLRPLLARTLNTDYSQLLATNIRRTNHLVPKSCSIIPIIR